ncbi:MAG: hypothetical protein ACLPUO_04370 [Streptosporangiaceae bacterium]
MAIVSGVSLESLAGPQPFARYLSAVADGTGKPADLLAVAVEPDGGEAADPGLDQYLPVSAAEIIASYALTGAAGEAAETIARIGQRAARVVFLGVGDRSAAALRRAGAAQGRVGDGGIAARRASLRRRGRRQAAAAAARAGHRP